MAEHRLPEAVHRHPRHAPGRGRRRSPTVDPVRGPRPATRSPTSPTPSTPCRTRRSTWRSSRRCCAATSPTASSTSAAATRTCSAASSTSSPSSRPTRPTPTRSSNLFRLDHLATRMRRNAESLLVLAGIEPPRKWAAPVRLTDVIRAALGEVEDYQRVTVRGVEPATIVGSAAADLAHLLAELIENALVFSPPDQTVDIRGRNRHDGYTLAVIDSGLGMPPADMEAANRRLAGAESFTDRPVQVPGPLRGRQPGRPPRHHGPPGQLARQRRHRHHQTPGRPAHHRQPGRATSHRCGPHSRRTHCRRPPTWRARSLAGSAPVPTARRATGPSRGRRRSHRETHGDRDRCLRPRRWRRARPAASSSGLGGACPNPRRRRLPCPPAISSRA